MGRLAGFSYAELARKLRRAGWVFDRHAKGSHEIWLDPSSRRRTMLPNHPGNIPEGTVRAMVRQMGLSVEGFLDL